MSIVTLPFLVVQPTKAHTATVICVHVGPFLTPHSLRQRWAPSTLLLLSFVVHADYMI